MKRGRKKEDYIPHTTKEEETEMREGGTASAKGKAGNE